MIYERLNTYAKMPSGMWCPPSPSSMPKLWRRPRLRRLRPSLHEGEAWASRMLTARNVGALTTRIRFWGPLYCHYNKEPQNNIGNYLGPYITDFGFHRINVKAKVVSLTAKVSAHLKVMSISTPTRRGHQVQPHPEHHEPRVPAIWKPASSTMSINEHQQPHVPAVPKPAPSIMSIISPLLRQSGSQPPAP